MRAGVSADGKTIRMVKGAWRSSAPVSQIDSLIAFYERLRDRAGGRYAHHYAADVAALKKVKERICEG